MILRKPKLSELNSYKELELEFYKAHKPFKTLLQDIDPKKTNLKKEFSQLIKQKNAYFKFLEKDNQIIGYIYGTIKPLGPNVYNFKKMGYLNAIIILKSYRKKGFAKFMIQKYINWLKTKNIKYLELSTNIKNKSMINLNKKLGFKEQMIKFGKLL